jgi:DNA-binding transcriptional LysR family regulator
LIRLERELQNKLLHRDSRRIALTPAGRTFYAAVVGPLEALDAAAAALAESSRAPRGLVRVTAPPDVGRMVLAPMLVAFLQRYPEIGLDVTFGNRIVDLAGEGVDLALRAGRVTQADLIARKVCDAELQLAASPALAPQLTAADDIRALSQQPFVLYRAGGTSQTIELEAGAGKRRKRIALDVRGRISVDDYGALAALVAAGEGIGHMPAIHVRQGEQNGQLARIFPAWAARSSQLYLVYPARQKPERVRLLIDFLVERFTALGNV